MKIALIAHDRKKDDLIQFVKLTEIFYMIMNYLLLVRQVKELLTKQTYR
jgi:methylglyoxal synthase